MYGINISWSTEVLLLVWYKISYTHPNYISEGNVSMQPVRQYKYYDQVHSNVVSGDIIERIASYCLTTVYYYYFAY